MHENQGTARYRHSTPRNLPRYRSHLQSTPPVISQHIQNNPDDGSFWRLMVSISHQLCTLFWSFTCVIKAFSKCSIQIINLSVPTSTFSISVSPCLFNHLSCLYHISALPKCALQPHPWVNPTSLSKQLRGNKLLTVVLCLTGFQLQWNCTNEFLLLLAAGGQSLGSFK